MTSLQQLQLAVAKWVQRPAGSSKLAAAVARTPIIGRWLKRVGEVVVPRGSRFWIQVERGPAKGVWLKLTARVGSSYRYGETEPAVQEALVRMLKPGMVFVDAGANIGYFSLLAARLVGPPGRVIAFEPDAEVRSWLTENVERNGMRERISIHANALWRTSEVIRFERARISNTPDRGTGHIACNSALDASTVLVQGISLDAFCFSSTTEQVAPDLIKVDVEGAESDLLSGATRLLSRGHTKWIVEIHDPPGLQQVREHFASGVYETILLESGIAGDLGRGFHLLAVPRGKFDLHPQVPISTQMHKLDE